MVAFFAGGRGGRVSRYRLFIHNMLDNIVILRVEPCSLSRSNKAMNRSLRCTCFKQFLNNRSLMHNMLHWCPEICPRESRKPLTIITQHSILDVAAALDPSLLMSQKNSCLDVVVVVDLPLSLFIYLFIYLFFI